MIFTKKQLSLYRKIHHVVTSHVVDTTHEEVCDSLSEIEKVLEIEAHVQIEMQVDNDTISLLKFIALPRYTLCAKQALSRHSLLIR